jgi:DNA-binding MarR family transcriptional regulator
MPSSAHTREAVENLISEIRLLYNRIVQVGEARHADEPVTLGMRAVLEYLLENGPTTVPDIARSRSVTRQHIQMLVNGLLETGLVSLEENPKHKRSSLAVLTADGKRVIERMREREGRLFDALEFPATTREIRAATRTLKRIRGAFTALEE